MSFFAMLQQETAPARAVLFAVPQIRDGLAGRISRETYLAYLAEAYHHVSHTVPLLTLARERMDADHAVFRAALDDYIAEETGHEAWILDDIAACGGDRQAVRQGVPRPATARMVAAAYDEVGGGNPMAMFGMVYVLEGASVALASAGAAAVGEALGLGPEAFRYLSSHGALDQDHLAFFAGLMDRVESPADRAAIISMAERIFGLFADVFRSIPHTGSFVDAL